MDTNRPKNYNKYIKLFIPRITFDLLHYKLRLVAPEFEYDINVFYSILNDLSNIKYYNAFTANNGYIPLDSRLLIKKYGNSYSKYIQYLVVHSIISKSSYYKENMCFYYKLVFNNVVVDMLNREWDAISYCVINNNTNTFESDVNRGFIANPKVVKEQQIIVVEIPVHISVGKYIINEYNKELDNIKHYKDYLKKMAYHYKDTIGIDYDKAIQHSVQRYTEDAIQANGDPDLIETARNQYLYRIRSIIAINEGKKGKLLRFERNNTNKRIDTNLTNLSSDLRQFLNGYDNMSYFDLSNSQPVLFNILLKEHYKDSDPKLKAEIDRYAQITLSGSWYEFLMDLFKVDRDGAKKIWMQIAYSKNSSYLPEKKTFASQFPLITKIIKDLKKQNHANFAIELQRIESRIFIDEICKQLVAMDIIPYTLHDGLLVPKTNESTVYKVMCNVLEDSLGKVPVISLNGNKLIP